MKTEIWKTRTSLFFVVGLLVLAGVWSEVDVAWAQSQGECVPPVGVTPPADPSVTAQQVENGTASLKDFALAVRERARAEGLTSTGSMRCTVPAGAQEFTGVAVEMDAMNGIFTTLPLIPLSRDVSSDEEITQEE